MLKNYQGTPDEELKQSIDALTNVYGNIDCYVDVNKADVYFRSQTGHEALFVMRLTKTKTGKWKILKIVPSIILWSFLQGVGFDVSKIEHS